MHRSFGRDPPESALQRPNRVGYAVWKNCGSTQLENSLFIERIAYQLSAKAVDGGRSNEEKEKKDERNKQNGREKKRGQTLERGSHHT
ncbi:hypothetical protein Trydic_g23316 [Trypoxylus dichotomus]